MMGPMTRMLSWACVPLLAACLGVAASPSVERSVSEAGLEGWRLRDGAFELEVIQRLPDQTRAFFEARGFGTDAVDRIARTCVMQAILRNPSDVATLDVNLEAWRRTAAGEEGRLRLREDWMRTWAEDGTGAPARIAMNWALFPTRQQFAPGDYNWGMMSFDLPPGAVFDLDVVWHEDGERRAASIDAVRCAADE